MRTTKILTVTAAVAMLVSACGAGAEDADADGNSTTSDVAATTALDQTTSTAPRSNTVAVTRSEVEYATDAEGSWTMDVFVPEAEGPWPLVVVYSGMTSQRSSDEANRIARTGAVAVAPQWVKRTPPSLTADEYIDGAMFDRAACATAVAQDMAATWGADPADTTVIGYSAGIHPAAWVALGLERELDCGGLAIQPPTGWVSGDSQFIWYGEEFDPPLGDPTLNATDTVDRFIDPSRWTTADALAVYLWTSDYVHGRDIDLPVGADAWIAARDTTGTLVDELSELGALDDGFVDWGDAALLMEGWLEGRGIAVTAERVGGQHDYNDAVYEGIDVLVHRTR